MGHATAAESVDRTAEVVQEIEHLVRASYPLLYVVSSEERRVERHLAGIAERRGRLFVRWSITEGFRTLDGEAVQDIRDPLGALDHIIKTEQQAIFVLRDFHPFLKNVEVTRKVRDLNRALLESRKTAVVLSPVHAVPVELQKEVAIIDFPLPGTGELTDLVRRMVASTGGRVVVSADEEEEVVGALSGLSAEEAENALARSLVAQKRFDVQVLLAEKEQVVRRSQSLEYFHPKEGMEAVGGLLALKDWLRKRRAAFSRKAREFGLPMPRGLLLIGVPGCGKSLTAKAVASTWQMPLLRLDMGAVFGGLVGASEENIRNATKMAEAVAPCVLWLDELEKGLSGTKSSGMSDGGTTSRVFGTFITWLQEKTEPVFVIATANDVTALPPELLRKGRFDEIFFVDLPDEGARAEILGIHLGLRGRDAAAFPLTELAQASAGFSGSELEQAVVAGLYDAFERGEDLQPADVARAVGGTVPLSRTMREDIAAMRQWAESRAVSADGRALGGTNVVTPSGRAVDLED